jgi:hypothetical protein
MKGANITHRKVLVLDVDGGDSSEPEDVPIDHAQPKCRLHIQIVRVCAIASACQIEAPV